MTMLEERLAHIKVFPTVVIDEAAAAVPLARALLDGGLRAMEITFRTSAAEAAIRTVKDSGVAIAVAAGTLRSGADVERACAAGAEFGVSPGATSALVAAVRANGLPWLPGVATASEAMGLAEAGFRVLKLFPASGALLDALAGPLPELRWVPTGGVDATNAADFLARPAVVAVSGTWIAPRALIAAGRFDEIERRAATAARLAGLRSD
jgi:2-dehydro-3-deoxyphosphogluconate aldolase/(4S)-4-hydroxy-2-oxoglutarate aldolase